MADRPSRTLQHGGSASNQRRSLRRNALGAAVLASLVGLGACTADETQQPAIDPADDVLFTGERENAVPTTEAAPATTDEVTPETYHDGSPTTLTPETTDAPEPTQAPATPEPPSPTLEPRDRQLRLCRMPPPP